MLSIQERDIKAQLVKFLQKIFAQNTTWLNSEVEVISLTGNNSPNVYEQYPWDAERYPIVVLTATGGNAEQWGIDDFISSRGVTLYLGSVARNFITLNNNKVAVGFKTPTDLSFKLRNIEILGKYESALEDPILIELCSADTVNPLLPGLVLATGTLKMSPFEGIKWLQAKVSPDVMLTTDTTYFITLSTVGTYSIMLDTAPDTTVTPFSSFVELQGGSWGVPSQSSTILSRVNGPVYKQLGGGVSSTISIFIEAKDLSTTQKISNLIYTYLFLARHGNITRPGTIDTLPATSMDYSFMSTLSESGIYIINVSKSSESQRARGNDRVFSVTLTASCYSQWSEDFTLPELNDIHVDTSPID